MGQYTGTSNISEVVHRRAIIVARVEDSLLKGGSVLAGCEEKMGKRDKEGGDRACEKRYSPELPLWQPPDKRSKLIIPTLFSHPPLSA